MYQPNFSTDGKFLEEVILSTKLLQDSLAFHSSVRSAGTMNSQAELIFSKASLAIVGTTVAPEKSNTLQEEQPEKALLPIEVISLKKTTFSNMSKILIT